MGFAVQNPVGFPREDLRMAATGVGWGCETTNNPAAAIQLTLKTLFRHVQDLAGFVVKSVNNHLDDGEPRIEVVLDVHANHKRRCSCCLKTRARS